MDEAQDISEKIKKIRKRIAEIADREIVLSLEKCLEANEENHHAHIKLVHQFAFNLNQTPLGILLPAEGHNSFDILSGGAFCDPEEIVLSSDGKALSPNFQIDLHRVGKLLGFKSEKRFLEIWVNDDDWGQGRNAFTRVRDVSTKQVKAGLVRLCDAKGFNFSDEESNGAEFLTANIVGAGCLTESLMGLLDFDGVAFESAIDACEDIDDETDGLADSLLLDHQFVGSVETDCCGSALDDSLKEAKVWRPLANLHGPNEDMGGTGIVDQYSVFYTADERGIATDFKAYCHRWRH